MKLTIQLTHADGRTAVYSCRGAQAEQWGPMMSGLARLDKGVPVLNAGTPEAAAVSGLPLVPQRAEPPTHLDSGGQQHVHLGQARLRTSVLLGESATVEVYRNAASGALFARRADDWTHAMEPVPGSYGAPEAGHGHLPGHTDGTGGGATPSVHTDDQAVDRFAAAMKAKLAVARSKGRGGWADAELCKGSTLADMLMRHTFKGDPVDVANFCMFLHQRAEQPHVLGLAAERAAKRHVSAAQELAALHVDYAVREKKPRAKAVKRAKVPKRAPAKRGR